MRNFWDTFIHIFVPETYTLSNGKKVKSKFNWTPYIIIILIVVIVFCGKITKFNLPKFIQRFNKGFTFVKKMANPEWSYWDIAKQALWDTIIIAFVGTALGCALALPLSFSLASNFNYNKTYIKAHRALLSLLRTLPSLVYASLMALVFGYGTTPGAIATALFTYTMAVKMLYEQIETVDMGPYEALMSTGANRVKCMIRAIYPQIRGYFWSTVLYCFETNIRGAAVLGYVGAGGIGVKLDEVIGFMRYERAGLLVFVFVVVVVVIETITREIRRKLVNG